MSTYSFEQFTNEWQKVELRLDYTRDHGRGKKRNISSDTVILTDASHERHLNMEERSSVFLDGCQLAIVLAERIRMPRGFERLHSPLHRLYPRFAPHSSKLRLAEADYRTFKHYHKPTQDIVVLSISIDHRPPLTVPGEDKYEHYAHFVNRVATDRTSAVADLFLLNEIAESATGISPDEAVRILKFLGVLDYCIMYDKAELTVQLKLINAIQRAYKETNVASDAPEYDYYQKIGDLHARFGADSLRYLQHYALYWFNTHQCLVDHLMNETTPFSAFSDFLVDVYSTFRSYFVMKNLAGICERCDDLFFYRKGKKYCSPIYDDKDCGKAARNKTSYDRNRDERRRTSRERMKLDRAILRQFQNNPTETSQTSHD